MKTFKDLEFTEHRVVESAKEAIKRGIDMNEYLNAKQSFIEFDNGKKLSVIFGSVFYSNGIDTYECMELGRDDNQPLGYLSEDEVTKYMLELQKAK